ncbi:MAG: type II secretion system protein N [Burkholderiaceae bacterium]|nr:MAG: type II secretion system protein N [Burkholderiaceae bacterium]TBR76488.1 MAG: type II secretion system protein N [Burkholderiaceae bacterium]
MPRRSHPIARARNSWSWAGGGVLLGVLAGLLLFAPASWLAQWVARRTDGHVVLAQARGTIWNGSAQLVLAAGAGSQLALILPGRLAWRLRPAWGALLARVDAPCCTAQPLQLRISPRWDGARLALADGRSQWPAAVLAGLGAPWNTVQLEGTLALSSSTLSLEWTDGRLDISGQAQLDAVGLSSRLSTLKPMGSYRMTLNGGATPTLTLQTLQGSLQLTGSGRWVGSRLRFNGVASAAPAHEAALTNLLNILGRREGARSIISLG